MRKFSPRVCDRRRAMMQPTIFCALIAPHRLNPHESRAFRTPHVFVAGLSRSGCCWLSRRWSREISGSEFVTRVVSEKEKRAAVLPRVHSPQMFSGAAPELSFAREQPRHG